MRLSSESLDPVGFLKQEFQHDVFRVDIAVGVPGIRNSIAAEIAFHGGDFKLLCSRRSSVRQQPSRTENRQGSGDRDHRKCAVGLILNRGRPVLPY
jgi:hypothetical protein